MFFYIVCSAKLDIGFVVDGSGSIEGKNFQRMLDFLKNLVSNFNISPQRTRAGLVLYSRNAALKFNFDDYSDVGSLQKAIGEIKYPHGRTYTGKALRLTKQLLFIDIPRQGAKRVVLVMTDGSADDDITGPSKDLKNSGVTIYGLGIGSSVNENQLKQMASVPPRDHVFKANFHSLNLVLKQIKKEMCQGNIYSLVGSSEG